MKAFNPGEIIKEIGYESLGV
jgi:hypothetical protein